MIKISNHPYLLLLLALSVSGFVACKKTPPIPEEGPISPTTGSRTEFTLDSIFLYARQTYLWSEALPDYTTFNPRKYAVAGAGLPDFRQSLFDLSQYKLNPVTGKPYEFSGTSGVAKYSFMDVYSSGGGGGLAGVSPEGTGNDFGLELSSLGNDLYIRIIYPGSAAALAGLKRGDHLITINGQPATAGLALSALTEQSIDLTLQNGTSTPRSVQLKRSVYQSQPVLKTASFNLQGEKIGYLAFSQFNHLNNSKTGMETAFAGFAASGISTLVIDLRYNGGGYVETAKYMANLIVSSDLNGKLMFAEHYNTLMQQGKATILKNQLYLDANNKPVKIKDRWATYADVDFTVAGNTSTFQKTGGLETVKNIYFIVGGQTASASELLINSLKPYFKVRLVGQKTYGKPVGFFGIKVDKYLIYLSNFLIKNAAGFSDYFDGLAVDLPVQDDVTHDFGEEQELCLNAVFQDLKPGAKVNNAKIMDIGNASSVDDSAVLKHLLPGNTFKGMIEQNIKLKKE